MTAIGRDRPITTKRRIYSDKNVCHVGQFNACVILDIVVMQQLSYLKIAINKKKNLYTYMLHSVKINKDIKNCTRHSIANWKYINIVNIVILIIVITFN